MKRPDRFKTFGGLIIMVLLSFLILSELSYQIQSKVIPARFRRESMDPRHVSEKNVKFFPKVLRALARALKHSGMTVTPHAY